MNKSKLSADIANLLKPIPSEFYEDEELDDTSAKVLTSNSDEGDYGEISDTSKIRIQNIDLLESVDQKYAGRIGNRRNYRDSDSDDEPEVASAETDDDSSGEDESDGNIEDKRRDEYNSNEESEIEDDISYNSEVSNGDDVNFKHFTDTMLKDESNKAVAVRKQLNIWENLLEIRIKMKKSLLASNNMPIGEKFKEVLGKADEEYKNKLVQTKISVNDVLEKMISLQNILMIKNTATKRIFCNKDVDEHEISSDDDSDEEREIKRRKIDFGKVLTERHEMYRNHRNNTIDKWYDKTRIKHTESNSHTISDQINHILMDKPKLLKKTQMKRSDYKIIGEKEEEREEEYNVNIYDDEDFYHQQLRELVEFKSSDITDTLQLSRQWVQLQNMRSKMKRKIDTRATKGRKLKFVVHTKLVNHFAARGHDDSKTDDARDELINSLFKKK